MYAYVYVYVCLRCEDPVTSSSYYTIANWPIFTDRLQQSIAARLILSHHYSYLQFVIQCVLPLPVLYWLPVVSMLTRLQQSRGISYHIVNVWHNAYSFLEKKINIQRFGPSTSSVWRHQLLVLLWSNNIMPFHFFMLFLCQLLELTLSGEHVYKLHLCELTCVNCCN